MARVPVASVHVDRGVADLARAGEPRARSAVPPDQPVQLLLALAPQVDALLLALEGQLRSGKLVAQAVGLHRAAPEVAFGQGQVLLDRGRDAHVLLVRLEWRELMSRDPSHLCTERAESAGEW